MMEYFNESSTQKQMKQTGAFFKSAYRFAKSTGKYIGSYANSNKTKEQSKGPKEQIGLRESKPSDEIFSYNKDDSDISIETTSEDSSIGSDINRSEKPCENPCGKINEDEINETISWTSYIIFFAVPGKRLVVDEAFIFVGNIPPSYHSYFINFINWTIIGENTLLYNGIINDPKKETSTTMLEIDPDDIHLHIKVGDTVCKTERDKEQFYDDPTKCVYFFSGPESQMYKYMKDQLTVDKIRVYDMSGSFGQSSDLSFKERCRKIVDPRFKMDNYRIYGKDREQIVFSGLDIQYL